MIKITLIVLVALSGAGTGTIAANKIQPMAIEFTAGTLMFSFNENGVSAIAVQKSDYALRLKTQKGRVIAIRF